MEEAGRQVRQAMYKATLAQISQQERTKLLQMLRPCCPEVFSSDVQPDDELGPCPRPSAINRCMDPLNRALPGRFRQEAGRRALAPRPWSAMPPAENLERGFYVDLEKAGDGNLHIRLNRNGRRHFQIIREEQDRLGTEAALHVLLEDHFGNGWEMVPPKTSTHSPPRRFSDKIVRDDEGRIIEVGCVYWYPDYQIRDEIRNYGCGWNLFFKALSDDGHELS